MSTVPRECDRSQLSAVDFNELSRPRRRVI